jgi:hypothetical protein
MKIVMTMLRNICLIYNNLLYRQINRCRVYIDMQVSKYINVWHSIVWILIKILRLASVDNNINIIVMMYKLYKSNKYCSR